MASKLFQNDLLKITFRSITIYFNVIIHDLLFYLDSLSFTIFMLYANICAYIWQFDKRIELEVRIRDQLITLMY